MLRHALRWLLWIIPTLIGVSFAAFLFLSYVPDPTEDPTVHFEPAERERVRRDKFLELPRFFNFSPRDVRARTSEAISAIVDGDEETSTRGRHELARLGGAALPHVLPSLDALSPEPRAKVTVALAPIGDRMGFTAERLTDPDRAVAFWTRFWKDRDIEFRRAAARSAVRRLSRYGTASRAAELREFDTFVLEDVMAALEEPHDAASFERTRALVDVAAHVTGRDDRIAPSDDYATSILCVKRWRSYWLVYENDFVNVDGLSRFAAIVLDTRYGKWAVSAFTQRFGAGPDHVPVLDGVIRRAPVTFTLVYGAIVLAYAMAFLLGFAGAASSNRRRDAAVAFVLLALYAIPTAVFATFAVRLKLQTGLLLPMFVLALGLLASPTRQLRAALASVFSQEHVRASLARGASTSRALFVHALPTALLPFFTLVTLEAPMALGGAFVVERVFGLDGLGEATIAAVHTRDTDWLMAVSILTAATAALGVIITDLAHIMLDRRLAPRVLQERRER
jgi:ABC-type dipeptide/oligopeptide/nickel transport system permease component